MRRAPQPSGRSVTIADVAKSAGVSPATVSRVLNGNPTVAPELAARVREAVSSTRYVPNGVGRALRRQKSDMWAAIIPDVHNAFFTRVVEAFEGVANEDNYSVVLCNSREDPRREQDYIATAIAHQVSGVLIAATSAQTKLFAFEDAGIPVVTIDRKIDGFMGDRVTVDGSMIGKLAADHMFSSGSRRPLIVSGPQHVTSTVSREVGFHARMGELGVDVPANLVMRLDLRANDAQEKIRARIDSDDQVDGVFAVNGPLTSSAFLALRSCGKAVPDEVLLVGVDDDHWTTMVTPSVTVVAQPVEQIGRWAGQLLLARSRLDSFDNAKITLEPTLVVRNSSSRG